jgi:hypothetical protein
MILKKVVNNKTGKVGLVPFDKDTEEYINGLDEEPKVYHTVKVVDFDRYSKYMKLISIFEMNMPEMLELQIFGGYALPTRRKRVDYLDQHIRLSLGWQDVKPCNIGIAPNNIIRPLPVAMSKNDISDDDWVKLYPQTRDFIFTSLRNHGWDSTQLEEAFGCLFVGIPKEDYDNLKSVKNEQREN